MTKEYIEREAPVKDMRDYADRKAVCGHIELANGILKGVGRAEDFPAADVVEVVRCGECKHRVNGWSDGKPCCGNLHAGMTASVELKDDDFCSYGERRGNDGT